MRASPSPCSPRSSTGAQAEEAVARHLVARGWTILARNVRIGRCEIDIVAREPRGTIVFVEVRSRSAPGFGRPEESVDCGKVARLYAAAWRLLRRGELPTRAGLDPPIRVDLVTAVRDDASSPWTLRHLEGLAPP
jgi:putative endonuclease